jgi:hypothetical protein
MKQLSAEFLKAIILVFRETGQRAPVFSALLSTGFANNILVLLPAINEHKVDFREAKLRSMHLETVSSFTPRSNPSESKGKNFKEHPVLKFKLPPVEAQY